MIILDICARDEMVGLRWVSQNVYGSAQSMRDPLLSHTFCSARLSHVVRPGRASRRHISHESFTGKCPAVSW